MASWFKDAWDSTRGAVLTAFQQATQAAQVASVQATQAAQVAASQAQPIVEKAVPIVANAVLPGSGSVWSMAGDVQMRSLVPSVNVSAFNKTNTNTTETLTDSSVRVKYADNRIAASEGSIVAAGGNVSLAGLDPQAYDFGGKLAGLGGSGIEAGGSTMAGAIENGTAIPGTVGAASASSRLWLYLSLGVLALGSAYLVLRRRRK